MAVDQHRSAEVAVNPCEEPSQRPMIGLVEALDSPNRVVDRNSLAIDFLGVADHPGDGAESAGDPHGTGVGEGGQATLEHARIEFIRLAIDVDIAAREVRAHQRIAAVDDTGKQFIDERILRAPQRQDIEPSRPQELTWID